MPDKPNASAKHFAIDKANTQIVAATAIAAFITVFCLVASHTLWSQKTYNDKVTAKSQAAYQQLEKNVKAVGQLATSYKTFVSKPTNIIGGALNGTGQNDGDNAKIILDALPSQYDFPALTSSLEKILSDLKLNVTGITGTDDQVAQSGNLATNKPVAVPMNFSFTVSNASYDQIKQLINNLQLSIRPIQIDTLELSGSNDDMTVNLSGHTFYQPGIDLKTQTEVVK